MCACVHVCVRRVRGREFRRPTLIKQPTSHCPLHTRREIRIRTPKKRLMGKATTVAKNQSRGIGIGKRWDDEDGY